MSIFSNLGDLKEMKNQAQAMQTILAQEQITTEHQGITIIMNGNQEIIDLQISDQAYGEKEDLANNIKTALAESIKKVQHLMASKLGGLM